MTPTKPMATIELLDRQQTAVLLFAKLGGRYKWHQLLCRWALDDFEGLKGGSGPILQPFAQERKKPRYSPVDVAKFIEDAREHDGELCPEKFAPTAFEIDCRWLDPAVSWKLRRVQRCTLKTTARSWP